MFQSVLFLFFSYKWRQISFAFTYCEFLILLFMVLGMILECIFVIRMFFFVEFS